MPGESFQMSQIPFSTLKEKKYIKYLGKVRSTFINKKKLNTGFRFKVRVLTRQNIKKINQNIVIYILSLFIFKLIKIYI